MKKAVGYQAAELIQSGMRVGIGTGSTVYFFIERLIERCKEGLLISAFSSSIASEKQAREGGIPILSEMRELDITVDGADEIDPEKRMIKGGGGALFREKIIANASKEMIVIVDESKVVSSLGKQPLPVEVTTYATPSIIRKINEEGYQGHIRLTKDNKPFITDNGNYIYDIHFETLRDHPEEDEKRLLYIPGVIDTGFFFKLAGRVLIGYKNGEVKCLN
jgi:ribose 5-phosphate isomerase A